MGRSRRVEQACRDVREDKEAEVTERLETFTYTRAQTLTDKQEGRHGTTCSPEQEALAFVTTPTKVSRVVQFFFLPAPSPSHLFLPLSGEYFTFKYAISITPKPRDPLPTPPQKSKHSLKRISTCLRVCPSLCLLSSLTPHCLKLCYNSELTQPFFS